MDGIPVVWGQLIESIALICDKNFLLDWPNVIENLADYLTQRRDQVNTALETIHLICKKYRYKSDSNFSSEIDRAVCIFGQLTECLKGTMSSIQQQQEDYEPLYVSILLMTKILHSLSVQGLPEIVQENVSIWMKSFHSLLSKDVPSDRKKAKVFRII